MANANATLHSYVELTISMSKAEAEMLAGLLQNAQVSSEPPAMTAVRQAVFGAIRQVVK